MSLFDEAIRLLTTPPGGLVYYLILLFSIEVILGLAVNRWRQGDRQGLTPRVLIFGGIALATSLALTLLTLLGDQGLFDAVQVLPPTQRYFDALLVLLVGWAYVLPSMKDRTVDGLLLALPTGLLTILYAFFTYSWSSELLQDPSLSYNTHPQAFVWMGLQVLLLLPALAYTFVRPDLRDGTLIAALGVLLVGRLLDLFVPTEASHIGGWTRLANLTAYPLLAVTTYRQLIGQLARYTAELEAAGRDSLTQITALLQLQEITQQLTESLDLDTVLHRAAEGATRLLQSDLCAIAFQVDEEMGTMEIATIYNPRREISPAERTFPMHLHPAIEHAMRRKKPVTVQATANGTRPSENGLYALLGVTQNGPLMVQPLLHGPRAVGVLIIGRSNSRTPYTLGEERLAGALAAQIAIAVDNARLYQRMERKAEELALNLRRHERDVARRRSQLESELEQAKEAAQTFADRIQELEQLVHSQQTELATQERQLRELERQRQALQEQLEAQTEQLQELEELRGRLNEQAEQLASYAALQVQLEEQTKQLAELEALRARIAERDRQIQALQEELHHSEEQIARLTRKLADMDTARMNAETALEEKIQAYADLEAKLDEAQAARVELETQLHLLQQQIHQREEQAAAQTSIDSLGFGLLIANLQGQIFQVNPAATQLLGQTSEELLHSSLSDLWPDHAQWQHHIQQVLSSSNNIPRHVLLRQNERDLLATITTTSNAISVAFHDITSFWEQQQAKDTFLASLVQEFRTPMTSISGYTDLLISQSVGPLSDMQQKFLQRVRANIERMEHMLNDLLGVTAIETGQLHLEIEPIDIPQLIHQALEQTHARFTEQSITYRLDVDPDLPLVQGDREHILQVLVNLLNNACNCSPPGSTIQIQARAAAENSAVHLAITDQGGGIAPEDLPRVFERFYRADHALIAGLGETGIGLALAKALVEAHDGTIWVESQQGQGSTFHVHLPVSGPSRG